MEAKDWAFVFPDSKRKQEQGQFMTCDAFNMKNKSTSLDKAKLQSIFFLFLFKMKAWPGKNVTSKGKWVLLHVVYGCERWDDWVKEGKG